MYLVALLAADKQIMGFVQHLMFCYFFAFRAVRLDIHG